MTGASMVAIVTAAGKGSGGAVLQRLADSVFKVAALSPAGAARTAAEAFGAKAKDLAAIVDAAMKERDRIDAVACLVSERSGYITGQNLAVDGGITRSI